MGPAVEVDVSPTYFRKWVHPFCYRFDGSGREEREDKTFHACHDGCLLVGGAVPQQGP